MDCGPKERKKRSNSADKKNYRNNNINKKGKNDKNEKNDKNSKNSDSKKAKNKNNKEIRELNTIKKEEKKYKNKSDEFDNDSKLDKKKSKTPDKNFFQYENNKITENEIKIHTIPKEEEETTIIRGLDNIGATCYMNATLQSLSNTPTLAEYFLNEFKLNENDGSKKLSNAFYVLLKHLWKKNAKKKSFPPNDFKKVLSEENPLFSGIAANDSKDLLNFILERLHKELNKKENDNENINIYNNEQNLDQAQLNEEMMKTIFFKDFTKNYRSIISDNFYFTMETKVKCLGCNLIKYNFQVNPFIEFPLEEVNKYLYSQGRLMSLVNLDGSNPDVNIYNCFEYYNKIDLMSGENKMYCNNCQKCWDSYYQNILYILPKYLIINLNRGKNAAYQCKVLFPEQLDITNYVTYKDMNTKFELYAVICHIGPSSMSGHFVAYCRNRMDQKWYLYNDAIVTLCQQPNEYQNKMPYILFYRSLNNKI